MNRLGHLGFSLLLLSPLLKFFPISYVLFAIALAMLPDIDLVLRVKHRKYTHNVTFALLIAVLSYVLLASFLLSILAFLSVLLHVIADLMTKQKFAPLYPFSQKKFALKLFRSDNKSVNYIVFLLGLISFMHFSNVEVSLDLIRFI
ncbi:MAG: metal-dependent hydrolase [Archaeoglobaceae archaeon]|uniref:Metal-dependent hydrolase n=1 Tax=Archaeoglobus fulgidus TaxID=2234 RepID=A0A7J3M2K7_ARCFL